MPSLTASDSLQACHWHAGRTCATRLHRAAVAEGTIIIYSEVRHSSSIPGGSGVIDAWCTHAESVRTSHQLLHCRECPQIYDDHRSCQWQCSAQLLHADPHDRDIGALRIDICACICARARRRPVHGHVGNAEVARRPPLHPSQPALPPHGALCGQW